MAIDKNKLKGIKVTFMKWGSFGPVHMATMALAAIIVMALYFALRRRSMKTKTWVLGILSFSGIAAIIFNLVMWDSPLEYLPLHLCSINAMLLPVVVFTRNKTLGNLLLVWGLGAFAALVLNFEMTNVDLFSATFFFYYFPHVMECGIPLLLFRLGMVEKDHRCIPSTLGITMGIYTAVHLCNKLINWYCVANHVTNGGESVIQVNYMFSVAATNPLTAMFYKVIPVEYWYMYMIVPILAVYLLCVYAPQLRRSYGKIVHRCKYA